MAQQNPLTPLELLKRQLADWQQFYADMTFDNAPATDLAYAQAKIDQLIKEISQYETK